MTKLEVSPHLLESLRTLSTLLETEDSLHETLDSVAKLTVGTLPGCDGAGVTLRGNGHAMTAAASDEYTLEIDKIQYDSGEGPCLTALETSEFQSIEAASEESRWPEFCRHAVDNGFGSCLSFPLNNAGSLGALNVYSKSERAFDETSRAVGEIFASQATVALRNASIYVAARQLASQLTEAVQTRDLIGQAKGILMEREGVTDAEAFEMLRTISQNSNVKLRDVAQRLLDEKAAGR